MALDLPLPRQILTHAHWTLGREKMSKSTGNVVNPFFALDRFGVDTMRYYLAHDGGIRDDADYDNSYIIERYKTGLQGKLGNLVSRITRGKGWNVRRAVQGGQIQSDSNLATSLKEHLQDLPDAVAKKMDELDPGAALHLIMQTVYKVRKSVPHAHMETSLITIGRLTPTLNNPTPGTTSTPPSPAKSTPSSFSAPNRYGSAASYCSLTCPRR